jgi:rod shape determining protein RodA
MKRISRWHMDPPLILSLLLLCAASLFILYSASGEDLGLVLRQSVRIFLAFLIMFAFAQVSPETLQRWSPYLYLGGLGLLVLVLVIGIIGKGAQRWIDLGLFRFQPSEIMKLGVPLMVAWYLARQELPPRLRDALVAVFVVLVPAFLVVKQPDLGTAILIAVAGLIIIVLAGLKWRYLIGVCAAGAAAAPFLWTLLHDYQQRRILTLFDPWSDPLGAGYHSIQSMIAIGSGGAEGKGWLNGSQSQLEFIPERQTDFIFSVFSEEFGLLGVAVLLFLYLFIVMRGLFIAFDARDTFSRLVAGSLSLTFFFYVFVNMGMVSGMLPVVGVPLPLVSYGGTSMVTLMAGFGILMSIYTHRTLMSG